MTTDQTALGCRVGSLWIRSNRGAGIVNIGAVDLDPVDGVQVEFGRVQFQRRFAELAAFFSFDCRRVRPLNHVVA